MSTRAAARHSALLSRLQDERPLLAVELRPPRAGLSYTQSMDTWIDMYHGIRRLARRDTVIFLTDNAVGQAEEENLNHLTTNIAGDVEPGRLVPFLTCKHTLDYCLMYATRAASHGFEALTVLGGDRQMGPPRCVEYAYELRRMIRERIPGLTLGGWANPHRDAAEQVAFLQNGQFNAEFYLTQVVSHHSIRQVARLVREAEQRRVPYPGVFGVFFYRSANAQTLETLRRFFPVPAEELTREFDAGLSPETICARTIRALRDVGVTKIYISNLGFRRPDDHFRRIVDVVDG